MASVFVVLTTALFLYVVFRLISDPTLTIESPRNPRPGLASDHATFIGVITNLMFGLLLALTLDQSPTALGRSAGLLGRERGARDLPRRADRRRRDLEADRVPVMGVALLLGRRRL